MQLTGPQIPEAAAHPPPTTIPRVVVGGFPPAASSSTSSSFHAELELARREAASSARPSPSSATSVDPGVEFGRTDPTVSARGWSGPPPTFADAPTAEAEAEEASSAHSERIAAGVARMGPAGQAVAAMLASMTVDGDRQLCERMGCPWPMLSGDENAGNLAVARAVLTQAWTETLAMMWPRIDSKWSAPTMAAGAAVSGKVLVVVAARRGRVVDTTAVENDTPPAEGRPAVRRKAPPSSSSSSSASDEGGSSWGI